MEFLKKAWILFIVLVSLTGCTSSFKEILPNQKIFDIPPIDKEKTAELGDTIVSKGKVYEYNGIDLKNQVQAGDGFFLIKFTVPPQKLIAKAEDDDWTYYYGENVTAFDAAIGTKTVIGGLKIPKKIEPESPKPVVDDIMNELNNPQRNKNPNQYRRDVSIFGNSIYVTFTPNPKPIFEYVKVMAIDKPGFTQELIYNGRIGNSIKFLYREFSNSMMRYPFSQEVQYDLSESNIIGFKGARIEIKSATNTRLIYRVISSFPDPE